MAPTTPTTKTTATTSGRKQSVAPRKVELKRKPQPPASVRVSSANGRPTSEPSQRDSPQGPTASSPLPDIAGQNPLHNQAKTDTELAQDAHSRSDSLSPSATPTESPEAVPLKLSGALPPLPMKTRKCTLVSEMNCKATAEKEFLRRFPEIDRTAHIGELRQTEFSRLDADGHVYLDYTGGGLYAQSQLTEHMEMLAKGTFGNPHSSNPTSLAMTKLVEQTRNDILRYFNTDSSEYDCIFTANCSAALRIVGESYPFQSGSHYLLPSDNHNSVNGIREFARAKGAKVTYLHTTFPNLRMDPDQVAMLLDGLDDGAPKLFAYPAQSNFSGVQHSLDFIEQAHDAGWDVLLDAAAYAPTNRIDLQRIKPDYMPLSFYKVFGYPTGMGALIVKRSALAKLTSRPWFAGGTIEFALVSGGKHWLHKDHEAFEDGTINYLDIPALSMGLRFIEKCGIDSIHERVMAMTQWMIEQLLAMKHKNGKPMIQIYGPPSKYSRGGTITMNVFDPDETCVTCYDVEQLANQRKISLRAGCFCNPGEAEDSFQWAESDIKELVATSSHNMTKGVVIKRFRVSGAVRISVGIATNFNDLYACAEFFASFINRSNEDILKEVKKLAVIPLH